MNLSIEAWLGRQRPIEIAQPLYANTALVITFTVLQVSRAALNLTGYTAKFTAKNVATDTVLFDVTCVLTTPASGILTATFTVANLDTAAECLGELNLKSGGTGAITDRVQFRFKILDTIAAT